MPDLSPYLGRWVAIVRGAVVGMGRTIEEAHRLAKRNRPKEEPVAFLVTPDVQVNQAINEYPLITHVFDLLVTLRISVYLVGGCVRDLLLGRKTHDLDFAVAGDGLAVARYLANQLDAAYVAIDRQRGTGRVILPAQNGSKSYVDVASLRGNDLEADLRDRDFTINAIALERSSEGGWHTIDPLDGCQDLIDGLLRAASPDSFGNDPIRTLRAVRIRSQLGCIYEPVTLEQLRAAAPLLDQVSAERIRDEWFKILDLPHAADALADLHVLRLLPVIVPPHAQPEHSVSASEDRGSLDDALAAVTSLEQLLQAIENLQPGNLSLPPEFYSLASRIKERYSLSICDERTHLALLKCAAFLHNVGCAHTEQTPRDRNTEEWSARSARIAAQLAHRWHCSNKECELLRTVIASHTRLGPLAEEPMLTRRMVYRFYYDIDPYGVDAILVALARHNVHRDTQWDEDWQRLTRTAAHLITDYYESRQQIIDPPILLSGHDLIGYGLNPGPQVGQLLAMLREAQAAGEIHTRDEAVGFVQSRIADTTQSPN